MQSGFGEALKEVEMLKKQYLKNGKACKVTFEFPQEIEAKQVHLVGDFNNWDKTATPMKRRSKTSPFRVTLSLEVGREYQFRFLVDGTTWHNAWQADKYVPNPFGGDNSVVVT